MIHMRIWRSDYKQYSSSRHMRLRALRSYHFDIHCLEFRYILSWV